MTSVACSGTKNLNNASSKKIVGLNFANLGMTKQQNMLKRRILDVNCVTINQVIKKI